MLEKSVRRGDYIYSEKESKKLKMYDFAKKLTDKEKRNMIRYCESPHMDMDLGCGDSFYVCEMQEKKIVPKHEQELKTVLLPKTSSIINCYEMSLSKCRKLIDKNKLICKCCNQKMDYEDWKKKQDEWIAAINRIGGIA
jgi:hypothetical protein